MRTRPPDAVRLGGLVLAVLGLHLWLLDGIDATLAALDRGPPARPRAAVQMRPVAAAATVSVVPAAPSAQPAAPRSAAPRMPPRPAEKGNPPALASPAVTAGDLGAAPEPPASVARDALAARDADTLPVYPTAVPPPFAFAYELRRGGQAGSAELRWQSQGGHYTARFAGAIGGRPWLAWDSAGGFDDAGLAPLRHTDRRSGRSTVAANFQREAGKVTFSGPAIEHPLAPGAQDRLSWMLQLAAIAAADPSLVGPGGKVSLLVVGARGDADVWTFVAVGEERLALADGEVLAVRLLREPARLHDTRVDVWLDPARSYLPVGVRLSQADAADALSLRLQAVLPAP